MNIRRDRPDLGSSVENAERRIEEGLDLADQVNVAFSGGKDSGTVMHFVLEAIERTGWDGTLYATHTDDEFVFPETEDFVREIADHELIDQFFWMCVPNKYPNYASTDQRYFYPFNPSKKDKWIRPLPDVSDLPKATRIDLGDPLVSDHEFGDRHVDISDMLFNNLLDREAGEQVLSFTGVRASESHLRHQAINTMGGWLHKESIDNPSDVSITAHPVYDLTDADLWKIHEERGWSYNRAYDKLTRLGWTAAQLRTASIFINSAINFNTHPDIRKQWPELLEKAEQRFPGCPTTFEHGGGFFTVTKDDDQTWKDRTYDFLQRVDEDTRERYIGYIESAAERHWDRSNLPMRQEEACPYCGTCWREFAKLLYKELMNVQHE